MQGSMPRRMCDYFADNNFCENIAKNLFRVSWFDLDSEDIPEPIVINYYACNEHHIQIMVDACVGDTYSKSNTPPFNTFSVTIEENI